MRLNRFDLNLLVALDALLTEQNTTRAGKRINLSQPAMSCALARLRTYFNDPLLTQSGRGLVPTALGASLAQPVRELLMRAETTLDNRPEFEPAEARRRFKIMMSDYVSTVLMAEVTRRAERLAPGVTFEILPHDLNPRQALEKGDIDLLIMPDTFLGHDHPSELLFEDRYVCIACASNAAVGERISKEQYLQFGHVVARPGSDAHRPPAMDELHLERLGYQRRVEVTVSEFSLLAQYVTGSSRIATMHERVARLYVRSTPLKILSMPFDLPAVRESAAWHSQRDQDRGLAWVRDLIKTTAQEFTDDYRLRATASQLEDDLVEAGPVVKMPRRAAGARH